MKLARPKIRKRQLLAMRGDLVALYERLGSVRKVAHYLNASRFAVADILRAQDIHLSEGRHREHAVDDFFFDVIDSEQKAYWLGFLSADGCVHGDKVILMLAARDVDHLIKFRANLKSDYPIYRSMVDSKWTTAAGVAKSSKSPARRLAVHSKHMAESLRLLGLTPKKTRTIAPSSGVPTELLHHYWRGYFDGDGCISRKGRSWELIAVGNQAMVQGFFDFLIAQEFPTNAQPRWFRGQAWTWHTGGFYVCRGIVQILYQGAHIFLDRKMALAAELLSAEEPKSRGSDLTPTRLLFLRDRSTSWSAVARELGMTSSQLFKIRKRRGLKEKRTQWSRSAEDRRARSVVGTRRALAAA